MGTALVLYQTAGELKAERQPFPLPEIIREAGPEAIEAAEDFFDAGVRNDHTRKAYSRAVNAFMLWALERRLRLADIGPRHIGQYMNVLTTAKRAISTRNQQLSALRRFFGRLVMEHVIEFNPALSVRGETHVVVEGKTPEITPEQVRRLLASIDTEKIVGLRDRALLGILIYTAVRVGAAAALRRSDLYQIGEQWMLHFDEKNGNSREIPVREDLRQMIFAYLNKVGPSDPKTDPPIFLRATKTRELSEEQLLVNDACRMVKRRLRRLRLSKLSAHSFRVATITDLLEQGVPLEDVQRLAGHADPRTTRLYDRRDRKITRNIVERISI